MSGYLSLAEPFTIGFYSDTASSTTGLTGEVPDPYPVAIGGHGYLLDLKSGQFTHESIDILHPYLVSSDTLGEKNINPESLWRASQNTWHKGAGQRHLDRPDSDPSRFWRSKGVDPWTKWQLSLLPDTTQARASANTNLRLAVAGTYLYAADGAALVYTTNLTAFTAVTGLPGGSLGAICSDGYTIYVAPAGAAIYSTTRGAAAAGVYAAGVNTFTALAYVKGRLMAAEGRSIYNITAAAVPAALYSQPNTDFAWVGFAEGTGYIYAAGYSGDKSLIYKIGITADGTALSAPIQAGQLPDGEIIRSIGSYLGFILLGTSRGFRLCLAASNGDLDIGPLIITSSCYAFEGQDRFVWFGWDNYDTTSTGVGRLDLTVLNDPQVPAYTSDLMVTGQGQIVDIATFLGKRVCTVAGLGFYTESANLVASGTIDSGLITYDLPQNKIARYLTARSPDPMAGTIGFSISVDEAAYISIGTHDVNSNTAVPLNVGELIGETFELRQQLNRDGTVLTTGPVVTRLSLEANPNVDTGEFITIPILLAEQEDTGRSRDVRAELDYLKGLRQSGLITTYQEGTVTYPGTVDTVRFVPTHLTTGRSAYQGTCIVKFKRV